jgi:hypothetical protein
MHQNQMMNPMMQHNLLAKPVPMRRLSERRIAQARACLSSVGGLAADCLIDPTQSEYFLFALFCLHLVFAFLESLSAGALQSRLAHWKRTSATHESIRFQVYESRLDPFIKWQETATHFDSIYFLSWFWSLLHCIVLNFDFCYDQNLGPSV